MNVCWRILLLLLFQTKYCDSALIVKFVHTNDRFGKLKQNKSKSQSNKKTKPFKEENLIELVAMWDNEELRIRFFVQLANESSHSLYH